MMATRPLPYRNKPEAKDEVFFPENEPAVPPNMSLTVEQREALTIVDRARALAVCDQASLNAANADLGNIKRLKRFFDNEFDVGIAEAFQHHKHLVAQKKKWVDGLNEAEKIYSHKTGDYLHEQEQEQLRIGRERQRLRDEADRIAEQAADKADALTGKGQSAKAEAVLEKAIAKVEEIKAAMPEIPEAPSAEGLSRSISEYKFEVIAADLVPRKYCDPSDKKLRAAVGVALGQIEIPGVRVWTDYRSNKRLT